MSKNLPARRQSSSIPAPPGAGMVVSISPDEMKMIKGFDYFVHAQAVPILAPKLSFERAAALHNEIKEFINFRNYVGEQGRQREGLSRLKHIAETFPPHISGKLDKNRRHYQELADELVALPAFWFHIPFTAAGGELTFAGLAGGLKTALAAGRGRGGFVKMIAREVEFFPSVYQIIELAKKYRAQCPVHKFRAKLELIIGVHYSRYHQIREGGKIKITRLNKKIKELQMANERMEKAIKTNRNEIRKGVSSARKLTDEIENTPDPDVVDKSFGLNLRPANRDEIDED